MSRDMDRIKQELAGLQRDGLVRPDDVVEFAKDPSTALHGCFTWSDDEAAKRWRLEEARTLIRCYVVIEESAPRAPVRAFVSLRSDRAAGGGYRKIADVLSDEQLHAQLMRDAIADLRAAQKRYSRLAELKAVFAALDKVAARHEKKHVAKAA